MLSAGSYLPNHSLSPLGLPATDHDGRHAGRAGGAVELASSETAEELLLFFEEKDLVIATKRKTPIRKAPAIATVITAREIRNMGARNILDVLKRVPGIGISIADISVTQAVEVRGIRTSLSKNVLFMIDGHTIKSPSEESALLVFSDLSVESIKRVEVIRGPGSALYGANAFVAVINIVTKEAEDIDGVEATIGAGSHNTEHYNLLAGHDGEDLKIAGHMDYLTSDGPTSDVPQDKAGESGETREWKEKQDLGFNASYGNITLRGSYVRSRMGPYIGVGYALNDETVQDWGHAFLDLTYDKDVTDSMDITARLYGDLDFVDPYWEIYSEGFMGVYPDGLIGNPSGKVRTLGGELTANYKFDSHILTTGAMYENVKQYDVEHHTNFNPLTGAPLGSVQDISSWGNFNKEVERNIWAVYAQDVWNVTDRSSLTAGVRHDHYSDFGGTTNPRVGYVWEFMAETSLKLLYGSAFRAPSFSELYHQNNPTVNGNPDLKPEKIDTWEIGLERGFLDKHVARINYFNNRIEDLIILSSDTLAYENIGNVEVKGVEFEVESDFGGYGRNGQP